MKPELETLCAQCRTGNLRRYESPRGTQKAAKDAADLLFDLLTDELGAENVSMTTKNEIYFEFGDIDLGAENVSMTAKNEICFEFGDIDLGA